MIDCRFHKGRRAVGITESGAVCKECLDAEAIFHEDMGNQTWTYNEAK